MKCDKCDKEATVIPETYHGGVMNEWIENKPVCDEHAERFKLVFAFLPIRFKKIKEVVKDEH